MILGSTLFAKYQKMTGACYFFRSQTVTGGCHFCKIQKCQALSFLDFKKSNLSLLELAKVTVICHFRISKNDRRLSFLDSKKVTGVCYFWNQKSVMWLIFSKYNDR